MSARHPEFGLSTTALFANGRCLGAASWTRAAAVAQHGVGDLRSGRPKLLREGVDDLGVSAIDASAELKVEGNFGLKPPH